MTGIDIAKLDEQLMSVDQGGARAGALAISKVEQLMSVEQGVLVRELLLSARSNN
jgi:hypothetical protein